ncbi:MAG: hypothetical protein M3P48_00645 [Actinomycetota bacterium]|nr:hypothetical protein [Actinomycetota bacterium]
MPQRRTLLLLPLVGALLGGLVNAPAPAGATEAEPAPAAPVTAPIDCPGVMPVADVEAGMTARGFTVTKGQTPEPFDVEILGVMPDALAPGRDIILVEVSDLPGSEVISKGGGIWAGMSGSPVYVGDKLLGAIAFGFTASPSRIGGITPAEEMVKVLDYGRRATAAQAEPSTVTIPRALRAKVSAAGVTSSGAPSLERLPTPLGVSGLGPQRLARFHKDVKGAGLPVVAHASGRGRALTAAAEPARPVPGGNFVAAISYGDVTAAATGTTTMVCGGKALAFGHPFLYEGRVRLGANDGVALALVKDDTFGAFKLANVGAPFGVVDQDRLAAVRARLGAAPRLTPITASINAVDTRRSRTGTTEIVDKRYVPWLGFWHILSSYDAVFDEIGDGSATTDWTIRGTRANGEPFRISRTDRQASEWDVAVRSSIDVANVIWTLDENPYEKVRIDGVSFGSDVSTVFKQLEVVDTLVSVNGGRFVKTNRVTVKPRSVLTLRVVLKGVTSGIRRTRDFRVRIPAAARASSGHVLVSGGSPDYDEYEDSECLIDDECGGRPAGSFDKLVKAIESQPRNDDLQLSMQLRSRARKAPAVTAAKTRRLSTVVVGDDWLRVRVTR